MELAAPGAGSRPGLLDHRLARSAGYALTAAAVTGGAAAIAGLGGGTPLEALARGLIAGVPVAVGLGAYRRTGNRFGLGLAALGGVSLVAALAESGDELAYSAGRAAGWLVTALLIYLILAFPLGRLPGRADRVLVGATAAIVLVFFAPRLLLAGGFELPSPYTSCTEHCPGNAFLVLDQQSALVDSFLRPGGALAMVALSVAVLLRLRERIRELSSLGRRMLAPVMAIGIAWAGLLAFGFVAREADQSTWGIQLIAWSLALAPPALALAFFHSTIRWELQAGRAIERLAAWMPMVTSSNALRGALADALGDPRLQIVLPAAGEALTTPPAPPGRTVRELRDRGAPVAAVVYDEALQASPRMLDASLSVAGVVLANQRLAIEAEAANRELHRSRARIAASAERERRRIERDLHDGAQQRLVALRIELELAEELVREDPSKAIGRLRELEREVDEALEELRSLAHGVYPPLLADRGLTEAVRTIGARSALRVDVDAHAVGRYSPEVESAVYFCLLEALQNVLKHAATARRVEIRLAGQAERLRFSLRDDGAGGEIRAGAGITNMRDRLAAVGGEVEIASAPGVGTTVRGYVPVTGA
jgi:signal transduction histidine kinase